ncbi:MAG TPA: MFS transporter [Firmicutes bacterium]|nr:MFS transporter [Bacillota bacterium]
MTNLFIAVTLIYWFSLYVYMPILTPYVEGMGASLSMVGLILGSYGFTQMLIRIPLGIYADRIGKRKIFVIFGVACAAISCIGLGVASTPWLALVFRGLAGVAAAAWVIFTVMYASFYPAEQSGKAMAVIMFYTSLGQLVASTLGGFAADALGYKAPFIIGGSVGLVGLVLSTRIKEPAISKQPLQIKSLIKVGFDPQLLWVSTLALLVQAINFATIYGFNQSYAASIGANDQQLTLLMLVSSLAIALASRASDLVAAKIGERQAIVLSFVMMMLASASVPYTSSMFVLYLTQAVNGFGRGLIYPVLLSLSIKSISPDKRSTAMGFFQALYGIGMTAGPVFAGWISDLFGMKMGYLSVAFMGVLGCLAVIGRPKAQQAAKIGG